MKLFAVVLASSHENRICNVGAETEERAIALLKENYVDLVDDDDFDEEEEYDEEYDDKLKIEDINSLEGVSCTHEFVKEIWSPDFL